MGLRPELGINVASELCLKLRLKRLWQRLQVFLKYRGLKNLIFSRQNARPAPSPLLSLYGAAVGALCLPESAAFRTRLRNNILPGVSSRRFQSYSRWDDCLLKQTAKTAYT